MLFAPCYHQASHGNREVTSSLIREITRTPCSHSVEIAYTMGMNPEGMSIVGLCVTLGCRDQPKRPLVGRSGMTTPDTSDYQSEGHIYSDMPEPMDIHAVHNWRCVFVGLCRCPAHFFLGRCACLRLRCVLALALLLCACRALPFVLPFALWGVVFCLGFALACPLHL